LPNQAELQCGVRQAAGNSGANRLLLIIQGGIKLSSPVQKRASHVIGFPVSQKQTKIRTKPALGAGARYLVAAILFLFLTFLCYLQLVSKATVTGYQVDKTRRQVTELQRENRNMELQALNLTSPQRVETVARGKLGMSVPQQLLLDADDRTIPEIPVSTVLETTLEPTQEKKGLQEGGEEVASAGDETIDQTIGQTMIDQLTRRISSLFQQLSALLIG